MNSVSVVCQSVCPCVFVFVCVCVCAQFGVPCDLDITICTYVFKLVALKLRVKVFQILQRSVCFAKKKKLKP